jgi:hypothetical protein
MFPLHTIAFIAVKLRIWTTNHIYHRTQKRHSSIKRKPRDTKAKLSVRLAVNHSTHLLPQLTIHIDNQQKPYSAIAKHLRFCITITLDKAAYHCIGG